MIWLFNESFFPFFSVAQPASFQSLRHLVKAFKTSKACRMYVTTARAFVGQNWGADKMNETENLRGRSSILVSIVCASSQARLHKAQILWRGMIIKVPKRLHFMVNRLFTFVHFGPLRHVFVVLFARLQLSFPGQYSPQRALLGTHVVQHREVVSVRRCPAPAIAPPRFVRHRDWRRELGVRPVVCSPPQPRRRQADLDVPLSVIVWFPGFSQRKRKKKSRFWRMLQTRKSQKECREMG